MLHWTLLQYTMLSGVPLVPLVCSPLSPPTAFVFSWRAPFAHSSTCRRTDTPSIDDVENVRVGRNMCAERERERSHAHSNDHAHLLFIGVNDAEGVGCGSEEIRAPRERHTSKLPVRE